MAPRLEDVDLAVTKSPSTPHRLADRDVSHGADLLIVLIDSAQMLTGG